MYYELVVSKNGRHYFTTASHSLTSYEVASAAFEDFKRRFDKEEGFDVELRRWESSGTLIVTTRTTARTAL